MDITGERYLPAPRLSVWQALSNLQTLRGAIPGCQTLEATGDGTFTATLSLEDGPSPREFTGRFRLADAQPPSAGRIEGECQDGGGGMVKVIASLTLAEAGEGSLMRCELLAEPDGALAQAGAPMLAGGQQRVNQFLESLAVGVAAQNSQVAESPLSLVTPAPGAANLVDMLGMDVLGFPVFAWAAAAAYLFIAYTNPPKG